MIAVTVEHVRLREIDLTRHVKTPAGVKYFHKPIGSPIGGGAGHKVVKAVERDAKRAAAKAAVRREPARTPPLAGDHARGGTPESPGVRALQQKVSADRALRAREPNAKYKVRVGEDGKVSVDRQNPPTEFSHAPLSKGEAAKIEKILNDAKTPDDIHAALLNATAAQKYHIARRVVAQHAAAKDYIRKNGDQLEHGSDARVEKFYSGLFKIVPWMRGAIDKVRTSDHAQRLKDFKYVESLLDAGMDSIIKLSIQGGMMGLASAFGLHVLPKLFGG